MDSFRIAVKAFVIKNRKLLIIRRSDNDVHKPGEWDIPGGRISQEEDPLEGLRREVAEETGLNINILLPFSINHFTRDDKQKITMIIFLCEAITGKIKLSAEHTEYRWISIDDEDSFPSWLKPVREAFLKYNLSQFSK